MQYVKEGTLIISDNAVCDKCPDKATHFSTSGTKFCAKCAEADRLARGITLVGFPPDRVTSQEQS